MGAIRPTRAQKKPYKMDKTMVKAQLGAVLSNITKNTRGVLFCAPKRCKSNVYVFSRNWLWTLPNYFFVDSKVTYHAWKRGKVVNSVMMVP